MISNKIWLVSVGAIAAIFSMPATAAGSCPANSRTEPAVTLGPLSVDRCTESYTSTEKTAYTDVSRYYGQVLMNVSSGVNVELDKSFGKSLARFFGVEDKFTAVITVAVYARIADEDVLVYEKPVYMVSRDENGRTTLKADLLTGNEIAASPTFALDSSNADIRTQLRIALISDRKLNALPVIKEGVDLATKMGGPASLVTAVGEPAFLAVASRIQSTYEATLSDSETSNLDTILKYERVGDALKSVTYKIAFPVPGGQSSNVNVKLSLGVKESLITNARRKDGANVLWPNVAAMVGNRLADEIRLSARSGTGTTQTLLSTAIDQQGVPQKLEELSVAGNASEQLDRQEAVNKSCRALQSALQTGAYRLNDADAQLILFNELERGGVFERYEASAMSCTSALVPIWKDRYNLIPKSPVPLKIISWKAKEARLNRIARNWEIGDAGTRTILLSEDFVPRDIAMVAPAGFIPGVPVAVDEQGFQTFTVAVKYLADRKKTCFGNYKPTTDNQPWATAFVRFDGDATLYLATFRFDNRSDFLSNPGPRIETIELRAASEKDRSDFNQSGSCLQAS